MHLKHVIDWWLIVCFTSNSLCQCLNIYGPHCGINNSEVWGIFKTNDNTILGLFLVRWLNFTYLSVMADCWPSEFPPEWLHYCQREQRDSAEPVMARVLLLEGELLTWKSILELWCREWKQCSSEPFQLADLFNFHWNVIKGLNKSIRLKETYLSCSFNTKLDGVTVQQGVITWIDGPETHMEGLMWFHLISLLWISIQRAKWCASISPKSSFKGADFTSSFC